MCSSKKNDIIIDLPDINGSKKRRKSKKPHSDKSDETDKSNEEVYCIRFERSFAGYMHVSATSLGQAVLTVKEWLLCATDDDVIVEAINIHNKVEGL